MLSRIRALCLLLVWTLPFTPAFAKSHKSSAAKSEKLIKGDGKQRSDPEIRTLIRAHAPFFLEEQFRGDIVRLNKDGTFSREGEGGNYPTEGHWKVSASKLKMKWATGEEYGYRVTFLGKTPLILGHKPNKYRHYTIKSLD